ncbi:UNVERIFIED_CONTAM: hypothetical protein Sangu_1196600 [Sesamum angustifolium]|uniref:Uncharacterized protein n=1 Tax=Sesamum angustifolium TaxID=2727405 RepID=A0AAW2NJE7_9LAMI
MGDKVGELWLNAAPSNGQARGLNTIKQKDKLTQGPTNNAMKRFPILVGQVKCSRRYRYCVKRPA